MCNGVSIYILTYIYITLSKLEHPPKKWEISDDCIVVLIYILIIYIHIKLLPFATSRIFQSCTVSIYAFGIYYYLHNNLSFYSYFDYFSIL